MYPVPKNCKIMAQNLSTTVKKAIRLHTFGVQVVLILALREEAGGGSHLPWPQAKKRAEPEDQAGGGGGDGGGRRWSRNIEASLWSPPASSVTSILLY